MTRRRTTPATMMAATLAIGVGLGTALLTGTTANAATDPLAGEKYVALGDSFAAGLGLAPYTATPSTACFQSANGPAAQVAAAHQLQLTDVSCSGATIANILTTPQPVPGGGTVPVQLDAVTADTALVSLMIGGNDIGFSTVLASCAAASPAGPLLLDPASQSCAAKYGTQLDAALQGAVAPALDALLAAIRQKAPGAVIVLLGYPALSPTDASTPAAGCFSSATGAGQPPLPQNAFPFTDTDRAFLAGMSAQLDAVQKAAAEKVGGIFVSNLAGTDEHTPCAGAADPWLNGISLQSLTPPSVQPASMHPNASGAAYLASRLADAFSDAAVPDPSTPEAEPAPGGSDTAPSTPTTTADAKGPTAELANTGSGAEPLLAPALVAVALGVSLALSRRRAFVR